MISAIDTRRDWLTERSATGYVRRCHGDLHLGNLCLWEGKPVPFDALEFDEALATIDVAYDLAFLLMDLDRRVGREAANRVMNRYVARTGDISDARFSGFPLPARDDPRPCAEGDAAGRRRLSHRRPDLPRPRPVPWSSRSAACKAPANRRSPARWLPRLGAAPGALVLRSDEIRKRLHGADPETRLPPEAYTEAANTATNQAVIEQARAAATGRPCGDRGCDVSRSRRAPGPGSSAIRQAGVPFLGIWLHAPLPVLEARVGGRERDASDATVAVLRKSAEMDPGPGDWLPVDATDGSRRHWRPYVRRSVLVADRNNPRQTARTGGRLKFRRDRNYTPSWLFCQRHNRGCSSRWRTLPLRDQPDRDTLPPVPR